MSTPDCCCERVLQDRIRSCRGLRGRRACLSRRVQQGGRDGCRPSARRRDRRAQARGLLTSDLLHAISDSLQEELCGRADLGLCKIAWRSQLSMVVEVSFNGQLKLHYRPVRIPKSCRLLAQAKHPESFCAGCCSQASVSMRIWVQVLRETIGPASTRRASPSEMNATESSDSIAKCRPTRAAEMTRPMTSPYAPTWRTRFN